MRMYFLKDNTMTTYNGMPKLQEFLTEIGFSLHQGFLDVGSTVNQCNWYACRRVEQEAPLCTCNEKPVQIVVTPHACSFQNGGYSESVSVELCAQSNHEDWWELNCYGISVETLKTSLDSIEKRLIAAWKAANG